MLTKDLLLFRIRRGQIFPTLISTVDAELLALAESIIALATGGVGTERGELEEQAAERSRGHPQPKIAAGLTKLLFDRMTFEEPSADAAATRQRSFDAAATVLRALPDDASPAMFEQALSAAIAEPLDSVRENLYADHPDNRRMIAFDPLQPRQLLERYNLAQVQGLVLRAKSVSLRATGVNVLTVRRLLRWLKFCRLIADVQATDPDLIMEIDGPGSILEMEKKYGLQLAQFVALVPSLDRFELRAEITFAPRPSALLIVDERMGLVAPFTQAPGYVPEEIDVVLHKLADGPWEIDPAPAPRPVGVSGICVPDVLFRRGKATLAIEFFHPWHRHALARRLRDLTARPDSSLLLGVDEKLLKNEDLRASVADHPQVFSFRGFPSERGIRKLLSERLSEP